MDHYVKGVGARAARGRDRVHGDLPGQRSRRAARTRLANWATAAPRARSASTPRREDDRPERRQRGDRGRRSTRSAAAAPARRADGADQAGTATYRLDPAPAGGYTMMGAATVIADFTLPGDTSQVAARLLDVAPDGQETLVSRGLWRPATGGPDQQVFQLFPNGWTFAEGHVPKLELLPDDTDPGAARRLRARLQRPAAGDGVEPRAAAAGGRAAGHVRGARRRIRRALPARRLRARRRLRRAAGAASDDEAELQAEGAEARRQPACPAEWAACNDVKVVARAKSKGKRKPSWSRSQRASLRRLPAAARRS